MRQYLAHDEWKIIETGFNPEFQEASESIFSLGNGHMGQRANFVEQYSGQSLQGSYIAGVYYPDKTKVGWWKNGYPEYFAKVINSPNWIGIDVRIDGELLDLAEVIIKDFVRTLDMQTGVLSYSYVATLRNKKMIRVEMHRFLSMADIECGVIKYSVTPLNFSGKLSFIPYMSGDVENKDSNYDERFWTVVKSKDTRHDAVMLAQTKKLGFGVGFAMKYKMSVRDYTPRALSLSLLDECGCFVSTDCIMNEAVTIEKYVGVCSSLNYEHDELVNIAKHKATQAKKAGFDKMLEQHAAKWAEIWQHSDIKIKGDIAAQQGIRFNIFHLNQTYTGSDARLNIGPKGFTGEKYGGSAYWDTEAYCIPFYLATAPYHVTRNLLKYRYKHLQRAIENAGKLGFTGGAALYPMVTMNGEECHNEWEITFEEIHRNGAMAHAIHNYVNYTGDKEYLVDYGLEVLIAISRFWAQRVNWSDERRKYVMLGVTGPNEYDNNVNNNWYTNYIACWCMRYTQQCIAYVKRENPQKYTELCSQIEFDEQLETAKWADIYTNMYLPENKELGIFLQQDGYLDKEQILVKDLPASELPINQKWSWDRILRSCFIKQADVLQGIYFFEDDFDIDTIRRNFDFYEPRTVHESSLSPCVHVILASKLGDEERAYQLYLRTARLDLDDYNNDTEDGCHITSMAGTWMSVVHGFAGMRIRDGELYFSPFTPTKWQSFSFRILFKGAILTVKAGKQGVQISNQSNNECSFYVYDKKYTIAANANIDIK